jgi:formylglycine-generating enzyme required for sulfatase activity
VELSEACYLGATEVTVKQYHEVLQLRARSGEEFPENHPYVSASWFMAAEFCRRLTALPGELAAGRRYRLPTEAEWEYGCRAGTADDYCFGNDVTRLPDFAWLSYNSGLQSIETMLTFYSDFEELQRQTARSRTRPHSVGLRQPNAWGLYDMHGNAAEWTADWFAEYQAGPQRNPEGPAEGSEKVVRGGNWNADAISVRSGHRQALQPEFGRAGFRVVMERVAVAGTPGLPS